MKYILMDLDGTITNPKVGITKSIQYALMHVGIFIEDLDSLCKHIGPPLKAGFKEFYQFDDQKAEEAVNRYREYFKDKGIYENELYPGMIEFLKKIKKAGMEIIVATSKPEPFAIEIIRYFGLEEYFEDICGATFDETRNSKEQVIRYALGKNGITDLSEVVMVGDRKHDIEGAKSVGISSIGVLYGFGSFEELREAGADWIIETLEELYKTIMKCSSS